jgi:hypothetical protein
MVHRQAGFGAFEFVVLSSLRVAQLVRGCTARVPSAHKHVMTAQLEVAAGLVGNCAAAPTCGPTRYAPG